MPNKLMAKLGGGPKPEAHDDVLVRYNGEVDQWHGTVCIRADGAFYRVPWDLGRRLQGLKGYEVLGHDAIRSRLPALGRKATDKTVDIVIPVHNQLAFLQECIQSIRDNVTDYRLIIVNDGSSPEVGRWLADNEMDVVVNHSIAQGFSRSCNDGMARCTSPWICVLNSDTVIAPHAFAVMRSVASLGFDIVGPTTSDSSGLQCDHTLAPRKRQMSVGEIDQIGHTRARQHLSEYVETEVYGFCMLLSRAVVTVIGGFDFERYLDGYYEDADYVWRAQRAGFRSAWAKGAYVHHRGQASFEGRIGWEKIHALSERNRNVFEERKQQTDLTDLRFDLKRGVGDARSAR